MVGVRHDNRIRSRLTVRFGINDIGNIGFTEDISASGIFLKAARVFAVDTQLRIELSTEDNLDVRFIGVVKSSKKVAPNLVWSVKDAGMGIQIVRFVSGQGYYDKLLTLQ